MKLNKVAFSGFTRKYNLSKTLKFELQPVGDTKNHLQEFIDLDTVRAKEYTELKQIIDEYHKDYIENSLSAPNILDDQKLKELSDSLSEYKKIQLYEDKKKVEGKIDKLKKELRKQLISHFKDQKELFGKELITKILPKWLNEGNVEDAEHKKKIVENFKTFTTYLTGFHENRKNMYSDKEQSTAIAHRLIDTNFFKFSSNKSAYKKISEKYKELEKDLENVKKDMKEEFDFLKIKDVQSLFEESFFNKCLTQTGIDSYNFIIGGKTLENNQKIKGINERINLYRQQKRKDKVKISNANLPLMQPLYKQILTERESHSFIPDEFNNRNELLVALKDFWKKSLLGEKEHQDDSKKLILLERIKNFLSDLSQYELDRVYFKSSDLEKLSHKFFKNHNTIKVAMRCYYDKIESVWEEYEKSLSTKDKRNILKDIKKGVESFKKEFNQALDFYSKEKNTEIKLSNIVLDSYFEVTKSFKKKKEEDYKWKDFYSLQELNEYLDFYLKETEESKDNSEALKTLKYFREKNDSKNILSSWFKDYVEKEQDINLLLNYEKNNQKQQEQSKKTLFSHIESSYELIKNISNNEKEFKAEGKEKIKVFLDILLHLLHLIKPFYLDNNKSSVLDTDTDFYNELEVLYLELKPIVKLYDQTRNYIAKNKNRLNKIKINFENSTLLNGWDVNQESANSSVILRKKEKDKWMYYLAVMDKKHNKLFDYHLNIDDKDNEKSKSKKNNLKKEIIGTDKDECYEKINYKFLADPSKIFPKVFFSKERKDFFNPSDEIQKIREQKTYKKGDQFKKEDCQKFINFYKASLEKHYDWRQFDFKFSDTKEYKDISDFYQEVSSQGYKLSFDKIKSSYIDEKVKKGDLYLFKIYNKDFSEYSKGNSNLHTSYFKLLFEEENLKNTVFKLNGQAEVFYREATKNRHITHPKKKDIDNKNKLNPKKKSTFKYDLIKDKRFTEDKYFFHTPIALNFKKKEISESQFNQDTLKYLKDNKEINIIGIDRGERHLAYYTVINQRREILEQDSFNKIEYSYKNKNNKEVKVEKNYHDLLDTREKERDKNRKEWKKIENIKELKQGYLSHLVHKISKLMIEYNAIVVFEDLNSGFKRGRMKFEKQVYQKLEKALIDKLNYLVFKDNQASELGGCLKAYQLTAPFKSFKKLGKQTGFLFYVPAYYTSKVDPLTGFVNLIYPRYENINKSQYFFETFNKIYFNEKEDYFVFEYSDAKVNFKSKNKSKAVWKVCTQDSDRYRYIKKDKKHEKVDISQEMKELFKEYDIEYKSEECIKDKIVKQNKSEFFKKLLHLLNLTVQLRHVNPEGKTSDEKDFILSSVADQNGRFFDSRKANEKKEPTNADANGAYHIALKGLMNLNNIKPPDKNNKLQVPHIKNEDWLKYVRESKFKKKVSKSG